MKALAAIAILVGLAGDARAELWTSTLGELMKGATSIEVVDVGALDRQTGMADATVFETWRSTHAPGERITERFGVLAGRVKPGDRVLVVCDAGECPRAVGVERDGWYTLAAQEPMDGAFVVPNVVSHLALPALVGGKPTPSLCVKGTIALLDGAAVPFDVLASATTGDGGAAIGAATRTGPMQRALPAVIGATTYGNRAVDGVVVQLGTATLRSLDPRAHPDCKAATYAVQQPGPRSVAELTAATTGTRATSVFARGKYLGKPIEFAIDGEQIVLVGVGGPMSVNIGGTTTDLAYPGNRIVVWPVGGIATVVEALAKARSMLVKVGAVNVTLTYVPAK